MPRADRRLNRYIDALLRDRRPRRARAGDDLDAMRMAATLRAAHPGATEPDPAFVDDLARRLRRTQEPAPRPRRRQFLAAGLATAAASIGAGIGIEHWRNAAGAAALPEAGPLWIDGGRWAAVATLADLVPGRIVRFSESGVEGFVYSRNGQVEGVSAVCSHQGCALTADASTARLLCPCHEASFNLDGTPNPNSYALRRLPTLQVRSNGDAVEVLVPAQA